MYLSKRSLEDMPHRLKIDRIADPETLRRMSVSGHNDRCVDTRDLGRLGVEDIRHYNLCLHVKELVLRLRTTI